MSQLSRLQERCERLVAQGVITGPCSGRGVTRKTLEALLAGVNDESMRENINALEPALPLSEDVITHEILPQLSIKEVYSYCTSNRTAQKLCDDISFWKVYLRNYDHEAIQKAVLAAARANNLTFVRLLVEYAEELSLTVDMRTHRSAYYYFAERANVEALEYLRDVLDDTIQGLKLTVSFQTVLELIERLGNVVLANQDVCRTLIWKSDHPEIEPEGITAVIDSIADTWLKLMGTGVHTDYITEKLVARLGDVVLCLIDLHTFDKTDWSIWVEPPVNQFEYAILSSYFRSMSVENTEAFRALLEIMLRQWWDADRHITTLFIGNASYDVYRMLELYLTDDSHIYARDPKIWYIIYDLDELDPDDAVGLMKTAYLSISPSEWRQHLNEYSQWQQKDIIKETILFARDDGYTAWVEEAERLLKDEPI